MELEGASAIVVGGAGGLGEATVRRLVAGGTSVVIADLAVEAGVALADELGESTRFVKTNVLETSSVQQAIDVASSLAPLRISVDAHGGPGGGRTLSRDGEPHPMEDFARVIEIFLHGAFNVVRLASSAMSKTTPIDTGERGVIVNTASIAAYDGTVGQAAYAAAKGGIVGMTLPIARDLAAVGIRVGTIAPGVFATPAYRRPIAEVEPEWSPVVPFPKRMGLPDEFAAMVISIIENPYFNGEVIRLDGALRFLTKGSRA